MADDEIDPSTLAGGGSGNDGALPTGSAPQEGVNGPDVDEPAWGPEHDAEQALSTGSAPQEGVSGPDLGAGPGAGEEPAEEAD